MVGISYEPNSRRLSFLRSRFSKLYKRLKYRRLINRYWPAMKMSVDGILFELHPRDNTTERELFTDASFPEPQSVAALVKAVRGKSSFILDVGGNCGLYALPLSRAASKDSEIVSFEPNPIMARRMRRNIELNDFNNIQVEEVAIGSEEGAMQLNLHPRNLGQSSLRSLSETSRSISVPVRKLTSYIPEQRKHELFILKIDVEGFECPALEPLFSLQGSERLPDLILIEVVLKDHWSFDVLERFKLLGYSNTLEVEGNVLLAASWYDQPIDAVEKEIP